jgi:hypothetical protein
MTKKKDIADVKEGETSTLEGITSEDVSKSPQATSTETSTAEGKKAAESGKGERTFTQAEVDEIMGKVRGEGKDTAVKSLLKDLGVDTPETLKGSLKELADLRKASMTEQDRLKEDLNTALAKIDVLSVQQEESKKAAEQASINSEIAKQAAGRFTSVDAVLKLVDRSVIAVDEKGVSGVDRALEQVAETYPFTLRQEKSLSVTSSANPEDKGQPKGKTDDQWRQDLFGAGTEFFAGRGVRIVDKTAGEISEAEKRMQEKASE